MVASDSENEVSLESGLFEEPEGNVEKISNNLEIQSGYYPPPNPPTFAEHTLLNGETISVRMVGKSPLWGHMLWNAGRVTTNYIESKQKEMIDGKRVLELGAGAALPSIMCAKVGKPSSVVITDYPDPDLLENIRYNIKTILGDSKSSNVQCQGHIWGREPEELLDCLPKSDDKPGFDLVILADLIFNHSQHDALLSTLRSTMAPQGVGIVFFTPHRTWLLSEDLNFFEKAKTLGFEVEKVCEEMVENPMFENDKGPRDLRRTVFGYEVRWSQTQST